MRIDLPENVKRIIARLRTEGYEAYAVGGCVRDSLLGREPKDWDITTSALPPVIKRLFSRTVDTGIEHGTVTILMGPESYETTTYRLDGKYSDSRHPDSVKFSTSLEEDLKRRDFTINAMAYSDETGLVDKYGGKRDLDACVIRCVGDPKERFSEDALRILRAVRFAAQLDFKIDNDTEKAARELAGRLTLISAERIREELNKLLMSDHPEKLMILHELMIDRVILPEPADTEFEAGKLETLVAKLKLSAKHPYIRWALFMSFITVGRDTDECADAAARILRSLKFDNATVYTVKKLLKHEKSALAGISDTGMRILMNSLGIEDMKLLLLYRTVMDGTETDGCVDEHGNEYEPVCSRGVYKDAYLQYERIMRSGDCVSLDSLKVKGNDLIEAGVPQGREIGRILNLLLEKVLDEPELNEHGRLMSIVNELINGADTDSI